MTARGRMGAWFWLALGIAYLGLAFTGSDDGDFTRALICFGVAEVLNQRRTA